MKSDQRDAMTAKAAPTRRRFLGRSAGSVAAIGGLASSVAEAAKVRSENWESHFPAPPKVYEPLDQGMFETVHPEDRFGQTKLLTSPTDEYVPNPGMGYQVYPYEEKGTPEVPGQTEAEAIEKLIKLPFCDMIYMRTDWRVIQQKPGHLDLPEMWKFAVKLAKENRKRISFRIQLGNTRGYPECAVPRFVLEKSGGDFDIKGWLKLPHYHHPEFLKYFCEMNRMLADLYDEDPSVECADLAGYGAWGEWHSRGVSPFPDALTAAKTLCYMIEEQMDAWKWTPLVMAAHGGSAYIRLKDVIAVAMEGGCWWRRDNVGLFIKPSDAYMLTHRPPWLGVIIEDGRFRRHQLSTPDQVETIPGQHIRDHLMMKAIDLNANYWALWQHADNILAYREKYPRGFQILDRHLGYRVRPSWVWVEAGKTPQALVMAIKNDGCAPPPGILRIYVHDRDRRFMVGGGLDPGLPLPGKIRQCRMLLPYGIKWNYGLRISAGLEFKGRRYPVRWACAEPLNEDGSITLEPTKALELS
jgi:hypothetical protein